MDDQGQLHFFGPADLGLENNLLLPDIGLIPVKINTCFANGY